MVEPRRDTMTFAATAYALKGPVRQGIVAADPSVIPLGSEIRITGAGGYSGRYMVLDTGSKIKRRRIDIYIESYAEAKEFGRQEVEVEILKLPESAGGNPR
jgi:3D (Asp-Asp-Asp) domain-containing protein